MFRISSRKVVTPLLLSFSFSFRLKGRSPRIYQVGDVEKVGIGKKGGVKEGRLNVERRICCDRRKEKELFSNKDGVPGKGTYYLRKNESRLEFTVEESLRKRLVS